MLWALLFGVNINYYCNNSYFIHSTEFARFVKFANSKTKAGSSQNNITLAKYKGT